MLTSLAYEVKTNKCVRGVTKAGRRDRAKMGHMAALVRFGVSLEKDLLAAFDRETARRGYGNRSEALRSLIREHLVKEQWAQGKEVAGAILIVYDHRRRELVERITDLQHSFHDVIISTQHIHLDHNNCLEIVAVKGKPGDAERLADGLRVLRGVKYANFSLASSGKSLP